MNDNIKIKELPTPPAEVFGYPLEALKALIEQPQPVFMKNLEEGDRLTFQALKELAAWAKANGAPTVKGPGGEDLVEVIMSRATFEMLRRELGGKS